MLNFQIVNFNQISIKDNPDLGEKWVQEIISKNPAIIGLGDLVLRDIERSQPGAGRLDLLLQDPENKIRYEVEIQLGASDESHIIRTIEYWDTEKKRYPQYDHCAVLIAEDITSRFLNVIQLFNGQIPIIAIQMKALEIDGKVGLDFTKVLDELKLGLVDEDEEVYEPADRTYWEDRGSKETVRLSDEILTIIKEVDESFEVKYNKYYIGLVKNGQAQNFTVMRAQRNYLRIEIKLEKSTKVENLINQANLDLMDYDIRANRYRIRISRENIEKNREIIKEILKRSYDKWNK